MQFFWDLDPEYLQPRNIMYIVKMQHAFSTMPQEVVFSFYINTLVHKKEDHDCEHLP